MVLIAEIKRKAVHLTGLVIPIGYIFIEREIALLALTPLLIVGIIIEYLRLKGRVSLPLVRIHEQQRVAAYIYTGLASVLAIALFPKPIAILSLLFLGIGDTAGAIIGVLWTRGRVDGRIKAANGESPEDIRGMLRARKPNRIMSTVFLACLATGLLFNQIYQIQPWLIIVGAVGAALADGVPWRALGYVLDDNLTIPLLSGGLMMLAGMIA